MRDSTDGYEDPWLLEIRVHGVSNTPPHGMLDLPPAEIEQAAGDGLGSFWTPTPDADRRDRALDAGNLHHIPPGVRREAYSWGALARLGGVPLGSALGAIGRVAAKVLWAATVPFGLANAAYWARCVPEDMRPDDSADPAGRGAARQRPPVQPEPSAAAVRVFALALTLLLVAATGAVALATLGTACMGLVRGTPGAPDAVVPVCARVPEQLYWLARMDYGDRLGWLSLVPVLVVAALVVVARSGQVRFDGRISVSRAGRTGRRADEPADGPRGPLLYRAGFWSRRVAGGSALWAHVGATLALVAVLLAWSSTRHGGQTAVVAAGWAVIACAAVVVALRVDDDGVQVLPHPAKQAAAVGVALAGASCWALAWVFSARTPQPEAMPDLVGVDVAPSLLGTTLVALGAAGLVWRRVAGRGRRSWTLLMPCVAVAAVAVVVLARERVPSATPGGPSASVTVLPTVVHHGLLWLAVAALALPALWSLAAAVLDNGWALRVRRRPTEGWEGSGPGVFLLASAVSAAVYASLVVLGVQWWMRGGTVDVMANPDAADTDLFVDVFRAVPDPATVWVPSVYTEFGVASGVVVAVFVVLLVVQVWPGMSDLVRAASRWIPMAPGTQGDPSGPTAWAFRDLQDAERVNGRDADHEPHERMPGTRQRPGDPSAAAARVQKSRHVAAVSHRAELALGALAASAWAALTAAVPLAVPGDTVAGVLTIPAPVVDWALPALGAIGVSIVASALAGSTTTVARPWGIVWDLMCFLPRSAHPFGPPSYAERAVPELRARVDAWLAATDLPASEARDAAAGRRRVVLSAHSLGGVIAAAVVLIRAGNPAHLHPGGASPSGVPDGLVPRDTNGLADGQAGERHGDGRVGMLTYGVQLRPYFGRFFPDLFGPQVLGTAPCTGPAWRHDPWRRQLPGALDRQAWELWRQGCRVGGDRGPGAGDTALRAGVAAETISGWNPEEPRTGRGRLAARWAYRVARFELRRLVNLRAVAAAAPRADHGGPTLASLLRADRDSEPAWVNLWRRTDFLGFPVEGYGRNPVDRGAEEVDRAAYLFEVASHSHYYRTWAYQAALAEVGRRLLPPPPEPDDASPPAPPASEPSNQEPAETIGA